MKEHILKLYYQYRPEKEPKGFYSISEQFDDLPYFLRHTVGEWIESYALLGGSRDVSSRQVAALVFMIWRRNHNDY